MSNLPNLKPGKHLGRIHSKELLLKNGSNKMKLEKVRKLILILL